MDRENEIARSNVNSLVSEAVNFLKNRQYVEGAQKLREAKTLADRNEITIPEYDLIDKKLWAISDHLLKQARAEIDGKKYKTAYTDIGTAKAISEGNADIQEKADRLCAEMESIVRNGIASAKLRIEKGDYERAYTYLVYMKDYFVNSPAVLAELAQLIDGIREKLEDSALETDAFSEEDIPEFSAVPQKEAVRGSAASKAKAGRKATELPVTRIAIIAAAVLVGISLFYLGTRTKVAGPGREGTMLSGADTVPSRHNSGAGPEDTYAARDNRGNPPASANTNASPADSVLNRQPAQTTQSEQAAQPGQNGQTAQPEQTAPPEQDGQTARSEQAAPPEQNGQNGSRTETTYVEEMVAIGKEFKNGDNGEPDYEKAAECFMVAADAGNAEAERLLKETIEYMRLPMENGSVLELDAQKKLIAEHTGCSTENLRFLEQAIITDGRSGSLFHYLDNSGKAIDMKLLLINDGTILGYMPDGSLSNVKGYFR
ncbi:MAG: hypothetical protein K6G83_09825 [Lachnospiraceae bacterium]|nr:hypothetical protein [Lachnospiraceae bacterium]